MERSFKLIQAKIVIVGPHAVGKTSMVNRLHKQRFQDRLSHQCTVGASFSEAEVIVDKYKIKMQIWDTAGQERFKAMAPMYYRGANGAILVFDVTRMESFQDMKEWAKELLNFVDYTQFHLVVCGNKCDLTDRRQVSKRAAEKFAKDVEAEYFETSALEDLGVHDVFQYFGKQITQDIKNKVTLEETSTTVTVDITEQTT